MEEKKNAPEADGEKVLEKSATPHPQPPAELSIEVKTKLRRLENMEPRYKGRWNGKMLLGYADTIRPFEVIPNCA